MKIAACLIVKGTEDEAKVLDRALESIEKDIDGIFVTISHKKGETRNKEVERVCKLHKARISDWEWTNHFADARNFNFSQVPKDYDYIIWMDADDAYRGLEKLKPTLEAHPRIDAFATWYMYDFDQYKQPTVVHRKTHILRNDGSVKWVGKLHEDFEETRQVDVHFIEGIERLHLTDSKRVEVAKTRNVEISKEDLDLNPSDPRMLFNYGNSLMGAGRVKEAKDVFISFLNSSQSPDEKYLVRMRLASVFESLGEKEEGLLCLQIAIGMFPRTPDAYFQMGQFLFNSQRFNEAEDYILMGMTLKPKPMKMIVYNPRDYDYNPMMLLAKVYFQKSRPDLALPMLRGCLKIHPDNQVVKDLVNEMQQETDRMEKVLTELKKIEGVTDKEKIKYYLDKIPKDLQSHPAVCRVRNEHFVKTESSGKDLAYYCFETKHEWNPDLFLTKGFGGSEEAVVNLAKEWAKAGWNVTVYNSCGNEEMTRDGVTYKPFWSFNPKAKQDVLILWRQPKLLDHEFNATKIFVDVHDAIPAGEFTEKRLKRVNKVLFKTHFHRNLFPNVPDDKVVIIPNGIDLEPFKQKVKKDKYLLVNTSSPDRSMDVLPKLFKEVKKQVPEARLKWAYGWSVFDDTFSADAKMMEWKENIVKEIDEAGIECLGKIPQAECAKLYLEGSILAYPSEFAEIDCISVKKAQLAGCTPITSDFGAFKESVQYGVKVKSDKTNETWCKPYQLSFGIEDEKAQKEWVDAVVKELKKPTPKTEMEKWAKKFDWKLISKSWLKELE